MAEEIDRRNFGKPGIYSLTRDRCDDNAYFTYRNQVTSDDCPHLSSPLNRRERERIIKHHGRGSKFVKSMIYGYFTLFDTDENVFSENEIAMVRRSMLDGNADPMEGETVAGMDPTGGGDAGVFMLRRGTRIDMIDDTQKGDEFSLADYWITRMREMHIEPHQAWIDGMGMGGSVVKHMRRQGFVGINPFTANQKPTYSDIFKDRYTEILWTIKLMIQINVLSLPYSENLLRDMASRRYITDANGKVKSEDKKKHRLRENFSPDYLDTLVYLFTPFNHTLLENKRRAMETTRPEQPGSELRPIEKKARESASGGLDAFGGMPDMPSIEEMMRHS